MVCGKSCNFLRFSLLCKMHDNDHQPLPASAVPHTHCNVALCKKDAGKLPVRVLVHNRCSVNDIAVIMKKSGFWLQLSCLPNWEAVYHIREERQISKKPKNPALHTFNTRQDTNHSGPFCPLHLRDFTRWLNRHLLVNLFWLSYSRTFLAVLIQTPVQQKARGGVPTGPPLSCPYLPPHHLQCALIDEASYLPTARDIGTQSISQKINLQRLTPGCTVTKWQWKMINTWIPCTFIFKSFYRSSVNIRALNNL